MDGVIKDLDLENERIIMTKDGNEIECKILFTFDCEETMKTYVGFTDDSIAANGRKNIFIQSFNPFAIEIKLENVTDERELEMINDFLIKLDESCS